MTHRDRFLKRAALVAAIAAAIAAGALALSGRSAPVGSSKAPASSTARLNQRYTACIRAGGATWTLLPGSGGLYRVDIPAVANARCAGLDLAREAAGEGDAATAAWLAGIDSAPEDFWACVGAAGFHTPGGVGQRSDYASAEFGATARDCAAGAGISLAEAP